MEIYPDQAESQIPSHLWIMTANPLDDGRFVDSWIPTFSGELFERIVKAGRFVEDEARYFFQQVGHERRQGPCLIVLLSDLSLDPLPDLFCFQLISGVHHCHCSGVCHRDLKLENTLLDGNPAPR